MNFKKHFFFKGLSSTKHHRLVKIAFSILKIGNWKCCWLNKDKKKLYAKRQGIGDKMILLKKSMQSVGIQSSLKSLKTKKTKKN